MHRLALLGRREGEHLHLRELMHAIEPARGPAVGAGLGAEAVADAAELERQLVSLEDPLVERAAERDLGRRHEREVAVGDRVDLRLGAAGHEAGAFEDHVPREIGRGHHREALAEQDLDRIPLQREFEEHGVVHEKVEAVAGHLRPCLEVEELQLLSDLDVIAGLESERGEGRDAAADLGGVGLAADGRGRMGEVGNGPQDLVGLADDLGRLGLERRNLLAEPAALGLLRLPLGRVGRLADRLAHLARLLVEPVDVGLELPPQQVEVGEPGHVGG